MKENEIRPTDLMAEQRRLYMEDVRDLLRRKDAFVEVECPGCESRDYHREIGKFDLEYVRCGQCRTVYLNPRPGPEILEDYYRNSRNYRYWNEVIFPASEESRRLKIFKPRVARTLEILERFGVRRDLLVEAGAGFGIYCEEMTKTGAFARIVAVEPTPGLAETCRAKGLEVIDRPVERVDFLAESVDVVAAFEVIEHLFRPVDFVRGCNMCLRPGGVLILTCPNFEGFDISTLRELSDSIDTEHMNYFNPDSLSLLLERQGLQVLEISTPGRLDAELVRNRVLSGAFSLDDQPFLRRVLIDEWDRLGGPFQTFLSENGLSSNMWIVARK
jgi:2-polyprenyl-3-methyl-5-hydroxy-6-metoxy-1,4-benzoquinol methylase/ribosomal protein S27E